MEIHEPIDQKKKLNIIAIADTTEVGKAALCHGLKLAEVFQASLTVITNFGFALEKKKPNEATQALLVPLVPQGVELLWNNEYFFPELLYGFAEKNNTIMFVIGVGTSKDKSFFTKQKALRFIKPSRLPVMTVGKQMPASNAYQQVILPVDIERQAKEKALWAGYFSRFYKANIHILRTKYEDEGLQLQVDENVAFVEKLYNNLEIQYVIDTVPPQKDMDLYSVSYANQVQASLTVIMMTKYYTLADLLLGPHERKVIGNELGLPVLCINQRDDLYVLCT